MVNDLLLDNFMQMVSRAEDVESLNALILQLAVQGKLTSQEPDDEPASELVKRIGIERARLMEAGKIKKLKPLSPVEKKDQPFALPATWQWVRLSEIIDFSIGKTPPTKQTVYWENDGIPWVSISDMDQYGLVQETSRKVSEVAREKIFRGRISPKGTLLMSFKLTLGKVSILNMDAFHNEAIISIYPFQGIRQRYLFRFLPLFVLFGKQKNAIKGATLNSKSLANLPIPIPPYNEQKRIVERVDTLLGQTRELKAALAEAAQSLTGLHSVAIQELLAATDGGTTGSDDDFAAKWEFIAANFDTLYDERYPEAALANVAALKQTILQLAVQGKLTRQDPADEPASALLERIAAEKKRLVKEKKIRKSKPLPEISDEERPFVLPDGWAWVRFGEIANFINGDRGKNYPNKNEYVSLGIPFINTGHILPNGKLSLNKMNYISRGKFDILRSGKIREGDLVYCLRGATIGKTAMITQFSEGAIASSLVIIRSSQNIYMTWLYNFLISPLGKSEIKKYDNGSAQPNLGAKSLNLYLVPLPPLAEQKRIVTRVNALLRLCDDLSAQLQEAQTARVALRDAVVG